MKKLILSVLSLAVLASEASVQTIVVNGSKVATVGAYDFGPPMSGAVRSRELTVMTSGEVLEVDTYIHYPNGRVDSYDAYCIVTKVDATIVASLQAQLDTIQNNEEIEKESEGADGGAQIYSRYFFDRSTRDIKKQVIARTRFSGDGFLLPAKSKDAAMAAQKILGSILSSTRACAISK